MVKEKKQNKKHIQLAGNGRVSDLLERVSAIGLYLLTDLDHHAIARRLGMGTQRVTAILKGLKRRNKPR